MPKQPFKPEEFFKMFPCIKADDVSGGEIIRVTRSLKKFVKLFKKIAKKLPGQKRPKYLHQSSI
jgi:hypothetical protein